MLQTRRSTHVHLKKLNTNFVLSESSFDEMVGIKMVSVETVFKPPKLLQQHDFEQRTFFGRRSFSRRTQDVARSPTLGHGQSKTPIVTVVLDRQNTEEKYGMLLIMNSGKVYNLLSYEFSPAWRAQVYGDSDGIGFGDEIVSVNGVPVGKIPHSMDGVVEEMYREKKCVLTIQRQSVVETKYLNIELWKKKRERSLTTLGIKHVKNQIISIEDNSPAKEAGIPRNSYIVKIGCTYTVGMNDIQMLEVLENIKIKAEGMSPQWARRLTGVSSKPERVPVTYMDAHMYSALTTTVNVKRLGQELRAADQARLLPR
eukprot:CFRG2094T1